LSETLDDTHPLGDGGQFNWVAAARTFRKVAPIVAPAIVAIVSSILAAVSAVRTAAGDAQAGNQVVKNKSEAGYQVLLHEVAELRARLAAVELAQRRPVELPPRRGPKSAPRKLALVPPTPRPKALPSNLDIAERQVYLRGMTPPAAPSPDAAP
jgi:hypothetical protein